MLFSPKTLTLFLFFLIVFILYLYFNGNSFVLIVKKSEIWLMKKSKLVKAGIILPLDSKKELENILKMCGLDVSLELVISKENVRRFLYLYCPSTEFLHSLSFVQVKPDLDLSAVFFSIIGDRTFRKASVIKEKNVLRLENASAPFFVSIMTFSSVSSQQISGLIESLRKTSEKFDATIHLVLPLNSRSTSFSKLSKNLTNVTPGSFDITLSPYVVLLSKNLSSLRDIMENIKAFMHPTYNASFMKGSLILKNLLKITCRLYISNSSSFPVNMDTLRNTILEDANTPKPLSFTIPQITLGKLPIKDRVINLKIDQGFLNPALLIVRQLSSLALLIRNLASHLPYKWLILDFQGVTLQLKDTIGSGLILSEKGNFTPISLVPPPNTPLHDYLARLVNLLAEVLKSPATEEVMIRALMRTTNYEHVIPFLLEVARTTPDVNCQEEKRKEFISDVERGTLTTLFKENRPSLMELFSAPKVFLDLSGLTSKLTPTSIEFLTSIIIDLCPRREYALLIIASPPILINLLDGVINRASGTPILLFSTFNDLSSQYSQYFKSIIIENEDINQNNRTFSLLRKDCPPLVFHLPPQGFTLNSCFPAPELEAKILELLENFPYVTEELISQVSGASKKDVFETLVKMEKNNPCVKRLYLPIPGGKRLPVFFLQTNKEAKELIYSYAHDLIEKICNETGLLLIQARDPRLGLDGFINGHPFKLVLTKAEKDIKNLSQQLKKLLEKYNFVLVIFLDERDTKLASELEKLFGRKIITTHLGELNQLPLKLENKTSSITKPTLIRRA